MLFVAESNRILLPMANFRTSIFETAYSKRAVVRPLEWMSPTSKKFNKLASWNKPSSIIFRGIDTTIPTLFWFQLISTSLRGESHQTFPRQLSFANLEIMNQTESTCCRLAPESALVARQNLAIDSHASLDLNGFNS